MKKANLFSDYLSRFSFLHKESDSELDYNPNDLIESVSGDSQLQVTLTEQTLYECNGNDPKKEKKDHKEHMKEEKKMSNIFNNYTQMQNKMECSTISQDMVITGSLEAENNIKILGTIHGNVSSKGDVIVSGKVEGDISANNLSFEASSLVGNITTQDTTRISESSTIKGNINSMNVYISGTINGNIVATGHTSLACNAIVTGDIQTSSLEIATGAVINGKIFIER